jgi:sRNA-binding regulator protein Hfq
MRKMRVEHADCDTHAFFRQESWLPMNTSSMLPFNHGESSPAPGGLQRRAKKSALAPLSFRFPAHSIEAESQNRHAELFYLQKQIQSQTPMVIVLEDGERVEGCIEWYDRLTLKVRGRTRMLVYKSAVKYMYKLAESGQ